MMFWSKILYANFLPYSASGLITLLAPIAFKILSLVFSVALGIIFAQPISTRSAVVRIEASLEPIAQITISLSFGDNFSRAYSSVVSKQIASSKKEEAIFTKSLFLSTPIT